ncbi:MAG TPA: 3' terminal RNA ribose 2'-O-methyltransferase Hen1 [Thermoanaerobaculia bacterium]|jgi:3' terminal RNA ribose 2'-O-methyltransferase Hen1|nr:3' terminal RNA ribose 2'-O-methyltransferase Hen1 [Thermoanaerobaculia bacterium]
MLLTLRTTHVPATDLGFLLHKHPDRVQTFELAFGKAHVFYPEADETATTAALLLDVDPVGLVRGGGATIDQYVNDRPYVASSFLAVAIAQVFGTALGGRCEKLPELAAAAIPLEARIAALPCRGGAGLLLRLFEPLGYAVQADPHPLDPMVPEWGASRYFTVTLRATCRLSDLLSHLYVLIPVLDGAKHYWVGDPEVEKLVRHGEGWLGTHPEREQIARRYLRHQRGLVREVLARLMTEGETQPEETARARDAEEATLERPMRLHDQRLDLVAGILHETGAKRVIDLGCGDGKLLKRLLADRQFEAIVGMDVDVRSLEIARERLNLDRLPTKQRERLRLLHGSLVYRDRRLAGWDAAALVEVVEHLDPPRLAAFERVVFEFARPGTVVLTTPNQEYNVRWPSLPAGRFRHRDHRFEWTREEFQRWGDGIAARFGYAVRYLPVGEEDPEVGAPSQMGIFTRLLAGENGR